MDKCYICGDDQDLMPCSGIVICRSMDQCCARVIAQLAVIRSMDV